MKYFAYGSNMSSSRLRQRVPSAEIIGIFRLKEHDLRFHKISKDDSGKGDAYYTANNFDYIIGVLYEINDSEKQELDKAEGLGYGYKEKTVYVVDEEGNPEQAFMYFATKIDTALIPYSWYKKHVLAGAKASNLPKDYIEKIETIKTLEDPDRERDARERSIYIV